ncbi:DNA cytosine methyltransferase [Sphingobium yanoikuyae]|uniref:DNA cytosine methyltransferase n=1 Tax=Sphingobium yanoikuyae TaxID=13690 RepID=UPI003B915A24
MKAASCFSGIGGAELALPEAEWLWCAEIEKFPSAVLASRFGHPNLGDITAPDFIERAMAFGPLDLLAGGPPCQAFSVAGLRKGMSDPRGQLSIRFLEIAHAIRPRNLLVENVPGWLNHEDNAFGCFLGGLVGADDALLPCERPRGRRGNEFWRWHEERQELVPTWPSSGMVAGPWARAAWRVLDAQYAGLAQRRERVFLVADFGEGPIPLRYYLSAKACLGIIRRAAKRGKDLPMILLRALRAVAGVELSERAIREGKIQSSPCRSVSGGGNTSGPIDVAACLTAKGQRVDFEVETFIADVAGTLVAGGNVTGGDRQPGTSADTAASMLVAHTLRAEGFDASEDGTGRGTPIVPVCVHADAVGRTGEAITPSADAAGNVRLRDAGMGISEDVSFSLTTGQPHAIAFPERMSATQYGATENLSPTLGAANPTAVAIQAGALRENPQSGPDGAGFKEDVAYTLEARAEVQAVATEWAVRRLTPTEYERLQGYPDGHTLIEFGSRRTVDEDEAAYLTAHGAHVIRDNEGRSRTNAAADGPRYKGLGNAWAVACVRPIAKRIMERQAA